MPIRKPRSVPTAKEKQIMDRVQRAQRSYPKVDRHGVYREACAELAEETGADVESIWEEFQERAGTRLYMGELELENAEMLALEDVRERFRAAS
jgi:predicted metalloprotease